ncbi:hypothetical protein [Undibacterium sp. TS12]|uniref:hypothetical protein n=1 Tax=Undibacterium sp. TS12 TaxID=2908202 RepID=UPI001F4CE47D|nr:hypothetical protein [Undibacterium sp. TS12]MCH8620606.1 hypothetical protein [Undibacterium sp. TS12]
MRISTLNKIMLVSCLAFSPLLTTQSQAATMIDLRFDLFMAKATDLKKELNLNANQQVLWQQTENKLQSIQHQREVRRERLQAELDVRLEQKALELRDINPQLDQEEQLSSQENRQMRELFFTLNDALDDRQRSSLQTFLASTLRASPESARVRPADNGGDTGRRKGGMGKQRGSMGGEGKF